MDDAKKNDEDKSEEEKDTDQEPIKDEQAKDEVAGVLESTDSKITSMVDVQIQQEISSVLSAPFLDVLASVVPPKPTNQTPPPIPTTSTITTTEAPTATYVNYESEILYALQIRVSDIEKEVKELKQVDLFTTLHTSIRSEVSSDSFNKHLANKTLYHSFMESLIADENAMDQGVVDLIKHKKRLHDDDDKYQDPPTGPDQGLKERTTSKDAEPPKNPKLTGSSNTDENAMDQGVIDLIKHKKRPHDDDDDKYQDSPTGPDQGLKKRTTSKDTEPPKNPKLTGSSKSNTSSQPKSTGKPVQAKETVFEATDTDFPFNQGDDMGNTDEQPDVETAPKADWFKKPQRAPTHNPEWNKGKSVDNELAQTWLNDLANEKNPPLTFNDLISIPIDLFAFSMNRLKISKLTKADLVGPVYNLLKGICKSYVELEYNMEECYHSLSNQLDWNNPKGNHCTYDLSKPLSLKYMASITKTNATKYDVEGIEDMVPKLWSPIKVAYDKHAALGISY
ncbi:hypothetical protein Tco_0410514 [Tanacetum coccineum]